MSADRIIVSMTSYPKRITNVGKAIYLLLTKQTVKPDEIHLWLAVPEFPNKENDLPNDVRMVLNMDKVFLHWLPKNTYVHKRHEYFKIAKDSDCVFFIDDDVRYNDKLIESVMNVHRKYPNCIVCYNHYNPHKYKGRKIIYRNCQYNNGLYINKFRWCGQSMIPAKVYPKEILKDEIQQIRDKTSPISDECWFQPWVVYYNIPIYYLNFNWGTEIDKTIKKSNGLVKFSHKKESNGYERRDNWLYAVLTAFPKLMDKYNLEFNYV